MPVMTPLDGACAQHLARGAMAGGDPLTDSLYAQLEAPAAEGALPPVHYAAGLAEAGLDPWLWRLLPVAAVLGAVLSYIYPWGLA